MSQTQSETGPFLSKAGIVALVVVIAAASGVLVGLTQTWMTWTPTAGEDAGTTQTADFYDLDTPEFLQAIGDADFYLQEGAFMAMIALIVVALFAFGLLAYELFGDAKSPASLRSVLVGSVLVLGGTGAAASAGRFIGETTAYTTNFEVTAHTFAGLYVTLVALASAFLGLALLYFAASHRTSDRSRYDVSTQRALTFGLVALVGVAVVGYATVSMAPWTEIRGDVSSDLIAAGPGSTFETTGDSFAVTEHFLDDIPVKPFFEMLKDIQLSSGAMFASLVAALGGLYGLTYMRNVGDNEGAQVLMLVGAATVLAGLASVLAHFFFLGHAHEVGDFVSQGAQAGGVTVTTTGLANWVPLISGVLTLVIGGGYAMRVLPTSGRVVAHRPSPAGAGFTPGPTGGAGGESGGSTPPTDAETEEGDAVEVQDVPTRAVQGATAEVASNPAETLAQLDRRLIEGEITEETYWDLRDRL